MPSQTTVVMARASGNGAQAAFAPPPVEEVCAKIRETRPDAVFAPHVETSSGIILPDDYIAQMAAAAHEVGALMVLDCIASGCVWVDMGALGVDVLISAPQKGWSASPAAGIVVMSALAEARLAETTSNSFALDLKKWRSIMAAYEAGGHAYHATMPTDAIVGFRDAMLETRAMGFAEAKAAQWALGTAVRGAAGRKGRGLGRGRRVSGAGGGGQLHRRSRGAERCKVPRLGDADRRWRAAAGGRGGRVPHLPSGAVRLGQTGRCARDGGAFAARIGRGFVNQTRFKAGAFLSPRGQTCG